MKITQNYMKSSSKKVSIKLGQKTKTFVFKRTSDEGDNRKQAQAIIPNIIHSLDASHLMNIINSEDQSKMMLHGCSTNYPIISLHDCFGTLPNNMLALEQLVKKEFISLYTKEKFLEKFHSRFLQSLEDHNIILKELIGKNKNISSYILEYNYSDKDGQITNTPMIPFKKDILEIPNPPKLGTLNLNNIEKSKYFIC